MSTQTVTMRLDEQLVEAIEEAIVMDAARTGLRTRTAFITAAVVEYLSSYSTSPAIADFLELHQLENEAKLWDRYNKMLVSLTSSVSRGRLERAYRLLNDMKNRFLTDTYKEDIEAWKTQIQNLASALNSNPHSRYVQVNE